jgi:hypothetical protein
MGFSKTTLLHFHKHSLHMIFPFGNLKHLHTKKDYLTIGMLQCRLQYRYITRWITTNEKVKERVLLEGSHSSAGYDSMVLCSVMSSIYYPASPFIAMEVDFIYLDNIVPLRQMCLPLHYLL